jgi:hypothetical protein
VTALVDADAVGPEAASGICQVSAELSGVHAFGAA